MTKEMERMKEIEARKEALRLEIAEGKADEKRLSAIKEEAEKLNKEEGELRAMNAINLEPQVEPKVPEARTSAQIFAETNRMSIPMFKEGRNLLVSTGNLVKPTGIERNIATLPNVVSSIVDDVFAIDATGTGSWEFPYQATGMSANDVTEGSAIGTSTATFNKVTCGPKTWGVLDEISNQVKKQTPVNYELAVRDSAYLALRAKAKEEITNAILNSNLAEKKENVKLDADFLRTVVLGYDADESVASGCKLYINKADLIVLGKVRGTQDKKPLYEITFTDANNGTIKEGGMAVPFSINSTVPAGQQIYGQPHNVKFLMWGNYEVSTDDGGDYFKRNMLGIRGLATANAVLAKKNGMQLINQSTFSPEAA